MNRYELTPNARADLETIADYLADEASVERAIQILTELRHEFRKLADMPGAGHFREDLLDQKFKFWSLYSYVIVYRWESKPIQIIAIVHGARDLGAFLNERPA